MEKRDYLPEMFGPDEVDLFMRLRAAFDPLGIANPGKMFPGEASAEVGLRGLHPLEQAGSISRE
jgi:glycolate oxidase